MDKDMEILLGKGFMTEWNKYSKKGMISRRYFVTSYIDNATAARLEADSLNMRFLLKTESFFATVEAVINDYYTRQDDDLISRFLGGIVHDYIEIHGLEDSRIRYMNMQLTALREHRLIGRIEKIKCKFRR